MAIELTDLSIELQKVHNKMSDNSDHEEDRDKDSVVTNTNDHSDDEENDSDDSRKTNTPDNTSIKSTNYGSERDNYKERNIQNDACVDEKLTHYKYFFEHNIYNSFKGEKIKTRLRVVRPHSWKPPKNYKFGEGREIGTIVKVSDKDDVEVLWDISGKETFKHGNNNQFQLLLLDNSEAGVQHHVRCGGCDKYPIRGIRWHCGICWSFDLCTTCYMKDKHDLSHSFERQLSENSKRFKTTPRENLDFTCAFGIMPKSIVRLQSNSTKKGRVKEIIEKTIDIKTFRCCAEVKWNEKLKRRYSVGRNGLCELMLAKEAKGPLYYENHLPLSTLKNIKEGARVLTVPEKDSDRHVEPGYVGTVTSVYKARSPGDTYTEYFAAVQWDNGYYRSYDLSKKILRLFDNGPTGVEHKDITCNTCPGKTKNIGGIRWKCLECDSLNLCNICYMSNEHNTSHRFQRILEPQMSKDMKLTRSISQSKLKQSYGIFEGATVLDVETRDEKKQGIVIEISDHIEIRKAAELEAEIIWKDDTTTVNNLQELEYDCGGDISYYHDHLPILGADYRDCFDVNFAYDSGFSKKIQVDILRTIPGGMGPGFEPSLFLIFADNQNEQKEGTGIKLMEEVFDFAKKTKLPCSVIGQKVLFYGGSTSNVVIHYQTESATVQELVKKGFNKFERGDIKMERNDEGEIIKYFKRMAEYVTGEAVLPVIISLGNGGMKADVRHHAGDIPIIRLKKHGTEVNILYGCVSLGMMHVGYIEYTMDIKNPWTVIKSEDRNFVRSSDAKADPYEIHSLSDIHSDFQDNLDGLVCCLMIGVTKDKKHKHLGKQILIYQNALSMYLLKEGKWKTPKEHFKKPFSYKSIEYIYEEDMTFRIKDGLFKDLIDLSRMTYKTPDYREVDSEDDNEQENDGSDFDDETQGTALRKCFTCTGYETPESQEDEEEDHENESERTSTYLDKDSTTGYSHEDDSDRETEQDDDNKSDKSGEDSDNGSRRSDGTSKSNNNSNREEEDDDDNKSEKNDSDADNHSSGSNGTSKSHNDSEQEEKDNDDNKSEKNGSDADNHSSGSNGTSHNDSDQEEDDDDDNEDINTSTTSEKDSCLSSKLKSGLQLKVSMSGMFGLIFLALLQKQYWTGGKQLLETGCIRVHYILIGCVVLEDAINNWRTTPLLKEKLQRLKRAFTNRAIRIISCIHDADMKKKRVADKRRQNNLKDDDNGSENKEKRELGDYINYAGRLLVNHGYIEDAIKTRNNTFLDNSTVKDILHVMWYGRDKLNFKTIMFFTGLAAVHVFLLPLLMINMEARPLLWFYKKYKLPFMKVFVHTLGFLALLTTYAYMLLFDYSDGGIIYTDYFIISWMASFLVDETKQLIVAIIRRKWKSYVSSWWNRLDWMSIIVYTSGMLLKFGDGYHFQNAARVLLVLAFILLCIRILNLFCISAVLGPKLVMIQKMFQDTFAFMIIMSVIMMCYNISFYALLYPNSEFSWSQMETIIQNGYWMLFGELNLDSDTLTEPDCTFNRTIYESTILQRCPNQIGLQLTPYLKAFYGLIAVILLMNLLIAMYSHTFNTVQQESKFYWSQLQTDFLEEYSIKTVFPIHLQLFVLPAALIHVIIWFCCSFLGKNVHKSCCGSKKETKNSSVLNQSPMFVRVFLYNTNFDLRLKETKDAEENGTLKARGEIDLMEDDKNDVLNKLQKMDNSLKGMNELIMSTLKKIEDDSSYIGTKL